MIRLSASDVSLSYGVDVILDKISFSIEENDKLGIIGVNGAGKSSLVKIITGEYKMTDGSVYIAKDSKVGFLDQYAVGDSERTVFEEMLCVFSELLELEAQISQLEEQMRLEADGEEHLKNARRYSELTEKYARDGGYEFRSKTRGVIKQLGLEKYIDSPVSILSGGQKTTVAMGRLLLVEPELLILDEPTNHLDMSSAEWLEEYIKNYRKTVIIVSHDRYFLDNTVNKILEIENTHGKMYNGNYTSFTEQKKKDREVQMHHYNNQQKEIARIEAYIEQQRRWNRERNIIAAESRQKALDRMVKVDKPENLPDKIRFSFNNAPPSGNDVLSVRGLGMSFGEKCLFRDFSLEVKRGDKVFVIGSNGSGKSTFLKLLREKYKPESGMFTFGTNTVIGYYDQEYQGLIPENTVLDELWNSFEDMTQTQVRNLLALFLFKGDDIEKKVKNLSGGEKARLTLAKLISSRINVLLLDEPTNHLDINSREALEEALEGFEGTVIAVSHDRYFIKKYATKIVEMIPAGSPFEYSGSYVDFVEYKKRINDFSRTCGEKGNTADNITSKQQYILSKELKSARSKLEKRLAKLEDAISETENKISASDAEMIEHATNYVKLAEIEKEKQELEAKLAELYSEWENTSIEYEEFLKTSE
ncbi:MAG: ABC-F family ATP-binding cassette domain-containing protein [Ruminococcaceae bacterium]|nr:ABC-F family ATP-binding cassette domain-containing protein [Oscillospiraceae bacterium]